MRFKKFTAAICMGLVISVLVSFARFDASCLELKENILRLHIVANSNSEEDQTLKLKIRDRLLEIGAENFEDQKNLILAEETAYKILPTFKAEAQKVVIENGYNYNVDVSLGMAFFDTRVYKDFTLPAGEYKALKVVIGKGEGKNWWCVIFPSVCVSTATDNSLSDYVSKNTDEITKNAPKYEIKFKVVEWYETVKNHLFK